MDWKEIEAMTADIINGATLSQEQGVEILQSKGAATTLYLAGAHHIKETFFSDKVQLCSIINAKSGLCTENCSFCAQSAHHSASPPTYPLKTFEEIIEGARKAQEEKSHCYGIVTSGTRPEPGPEFETILSAISEIHKNYDVEPSASLGILNEGLAKSLAEAGCVTYHHNLETARSYFPDICTTHDYEDDVATIQYAKSAGLKVCCGGIIGLGESLEQRVELAMTLRELDVDSVPLNFLNPVAGTPLEGMSSLTPLDCIRTIILFRYCLPDKHITVCGGREPNLRDLQSWIFMAGASGTMIGNYLTTSGRDKETDLQMLADLEEEIHVL